MFTFKFTTMKKAINIIFHILMVLTAITLLIFLIAQQTIWGYFFGYSAFLSIVVGVVNYQMQK